MDYKKELLYKAMSTLSLYSSQLKRPYVPLETLIYKMYCNPEHSRKAILYLIEKGYIKKKIVDGEIDVAFTEKGIAKWKSQYNK